MIYEMKNKLYSVL